MKFQICLIHSCMFVRELICIAGAEAVRTLKSEVGIRRYMLKKDAMNIQTYMMNCGKRLIVQRLLPNNIIRMNFSNICEELVWENMRQD